MRKTVWMLSAALFFFCTVSFFASAQTSVEQIETGRFGAKEPFFDDTVNPGNAHNNRWLFLGVRAGSSVRFYTPSGDTVFTGGDAYGLAPEAGVHADIRIVPLFGIQAEAVFTWDNASIWKYGLNADEDDLDRYTRYYRSFSLHFPLTAKLNFYPGKFRISPFLGGYYVLPLGKLKTGDSRKNNDESFSFSVSLPFGLLGGIGIAYPLGPGVIFADLRYAADLGEPELDGGGGIETYKRYAVSLSLGFEFGLFHRQQRGSSK